MFVTNPEMEHRLPPGLSADGPRYWQAFVLGADLPWFLLTIRRKKGRARLTQTMAIAWESRLQELIEEARPGDIAAICRVSPSGESQGLWSFDNVEELWIPTSDEAKQAHGCLLFAVRGASGFVDSYGSFAELAEQDRRLLLKLN